jgi:hypothetical protein
VLVVGCVVAVFAEEADYFAFWPSAIADVVEGEEEGEVQGIGGGEGVC